MINNNLNDLIYQNKSLIYAIINKYTYYFDQEDLYQVAVIGLLNAYKNYKNDKNTKFSSYAYFYIKGEITKYLRESNTFKISKDIILLNKKIEEAENVLCQKFMRKPSIKELSLFLEIDYEKIEEVKNRSFYVSSLDAVNEEELNLYNKVFIEETNYKSEILDLKNCLNELDYMDKKLIEERYINDLTQNETSKVLNMSQVQVSRKEKEILTRLRTKLM